MDILSDKEIRERLVSRGAQSLSDSELISLLIRDSVDSGVAHNVARSVMTAFSGSLGELSKADIHKLRMTSGLGIRSAAILTAAVELGRRVSLSNSNIVTAIRSNEDIITMFKPLIGSLPHEEMWVVYLSSANTILDKIKVSQGGVSSTLFDKKIVVKRAVELLATSIILIHNHPSGDSTPSKDDIAQTDQISLAASLFEIQLLDHVIITADNCYSFRANGMLTESKRA